jgi:hypothetical protein
MLLPGAWGNLPGTRSEISALKFLSSSLVQERDLLAVVEALLQSRVTSLPSHIQSVYVQCALKLFAAAAYRVAVAFPENADPEVFLTPEAMQQKKSLSELVQLFLGRLPIFTQSPHLEVQERACFVFELITFVHGYISQGETDPSSSTPKVLTPRAASHSLHLWQLRELELEIAGLFEEALNPVAPKAQKKVPLPDGVDLDSWICEPPSPDDDLAFGGIVQDDAMSPDKGFEFLTQSPKGPGGAVYDDFEDDRSSTDGSERSFSRLKGDNSGKGSISSRPRNPFILGSSGANVSSVGSTGKSSCDTFQVMFADIHDPHCFVQFLKMTLSRLLPRSPLKTLVSKVTRLSLCDKMTFFQH